MDYVGQALYEHLSVLLFLVEGLVCWAIGFYLKDLDLMAKVYGAGMSTKYRQIACAALCRIVQTASALISTG